MDAIKKRNINIISNFINYLLIINHLLILIHTFLFKLN